MITNADHPFSDIQNVFELKHLQCKSKIKQFYLFNFQLRIENIILSLQPSRRLDKIDHLKTNREKINQHIKEHF